MAAVSSGFQSQQLSAEAEAEADSKAKEKADEPLATGQTSPTAAAPEGADLDTGNEAAVVRSTCCLTSGSVSTEASARTPQAPPPPALPLPLPLPLERERRPVLSNAQSRAPAPVPARVIHKRIVHRYIPMFGAPLSAGRRPHARQLMLVSQAAAATAAIGGGSTRRLLLTQTQTPRATVTLSSSARPQLHAADAGSGFTHNLLVQRSFTIAAAPRQQPPPAHQQFPTHLLPPATAAQRLVVRPAFQPPPPPRAPLASRYSLIRNAACAPNATLIMTPQAPTAPLGMRAAAASSSRPDCSVSIHNSVVVSARQFEGFGAQSNSQSSGSHAIHLHSPQSSNAVATQQQPLPPPKQSSDASAIVPDSCTRAVDASVRTTATATAYALVRQSRVHSTIDSSSSLMQIQMQSGNGDSTSELSACVPISSAPSAGARAPGHLWRQTSHRWAAPATHPTPMRLPERRIVTSTSPSMSSSAQVIRHVAPSAVPLRHDHSGSDCRAPSTTTSTTASASRFQWRRT